MAKKIVALVGTYRKNGITDQAVDAVSRAAAQKGADVRKIYLIESRIDYCTNCRACTAEDRSAKRGKCPLRDDMYGILKAVDSADGIILACPINFGQATAVMKKFIERCIAYTYWPWGAFVPKARIKDRTKKAVIVTGSATPGFIGRLIMPGAMSSMKTAAGLAGAKVVKKLHFGMTCTGRDQKLTAGQLKSAEAAGSLLV